ncbi:MAG: hypothetical protein KatS3mg002_0051 [Candidatus Woesearchaeota archaeon]|nr:MAG: hypothetical protein KatS3mg002_0051 [Candidatus Woesearchaeota archaeon]
MSEEKNRSKSHVIFSTRDKLNSDSEYYGKIYKIKNLTKTIVLVASFLLVLMLAIFVFNSNPDFSNKDNLRYLFSTSAQTLGAIFGIIITITFMIIQVNIQKYGQKIYSFLIKSRFILFYTFLALLSILLSLVSILFVEKISLFKIVLDNFSFTFLTSYLHIFTSVLTGMSLIFLPYFIYELISKLNIINYLRYLYENTVDAINKKNIDKVENNLSLILGVLNNGIRERDRDTIKEGIETSHDLLKFAICNQKAMNDLLLHAGKPEGMFNYRSNWFEDEILSSLESSFKILLETRQYNSARYLVKGLNSCATETLNFDYHESIRGRIIKTYQKFILLSLKENELQEEIIQEFRLFFERSLCLEKSDFRLIINDLFEETFVIELIKNRPDIIEKLISTYFYTIKRGIPFCKIDNENVVALVEEIGSIVSICNKLKQIKAIDSRLALFFSNKLNEQISDIAYLLSLFVFSKKDIENSKRCRKIIRSFLNVNSMNKKIEKIVTDKNDWKPRFNYLVHHLFTEIKEDNGKTDFIFKHKNVIKLAKNFNKMTVK